MNSSGNALPGMDPPWGLDPVAAVLNDNGLVTFWSPGAQDLLGYPAQEVMGRSALTLLASPQDSASASIALRRLRTQGGGGGELVLRNRDGRAILVKGHVHPLSGPGGRLDGWLALAHGSRPTVGTARHEEIVERSPVAMAILDSELRYVWLNDALVRGGGVSREESLGRRWGGLQASLDTDDARAHLQRVLETGEPILDYEYQGWTRADPKHKRTFSMSAYRLDASMGTGPGVAFFVIDATDRWWARERLGLLNEAGARIGSTLDVMRTAQELADVAVPRLGDSVTVDLLDWVLRGDGKTPGAAGGGTLVRAGRKSTWPGYSEPVIEIGAPVPYRPCSPVERCLVDGRAFLSPPSNSSTDEPVLDGSMTLLPNYGTSQGGGAPSLEGTPCGDTNPGKPPWVQARCHSAANWATESSMGVAAMTLPLRARGVVLGVVTILRSAAAGAFEKNDLLLAQEAVSRAAVCVDNARQYTYERSTALALQRGLLPHRLPESATLEVASLYLPADVHHGVGGDWIDIIPLSGARTGLVVGDVVGHGIQAAATMGRLRSGVHALAALDVPPDELLAHLDDLVSRLGEEAPADSDGPAATCLYLVYDPTNRRCTIARAGHPPPAIVSPSGTFTLADLPAGPPLGLGSLPFESATFDLPDETLIVLYTDGLLDAHDRDLDIGVAQLEGALAHPQASLERLCRSVVDTLHSGPQRDDIAVLLARTHSLGAHQFASWDLPSDPALVSRARDLATEQLDIWGLNEFQPDVALIVSELVTNAIRYGADPIRLRMIHHRTLICEVSDGSSTAPHLRHARTTDEGGRGLFLVAQLTDRWGTRHSGAGKTIWAELDLRASAAAHGCERPVRFRADS